MLCSLFLCYSYCGHGRAREYLKEGHIQELDCQATLIQMGCSSGKLQVQSGTDQGEGRGPPQKF